MHSGMPGQAGETSQAAAVRSISNDIRDPSVSTYQPARLKWLKHFIDFLFADYTELGKMEEPDMARLIIMHFYGRSRG